MSQLSLMPPPIEAKARRMGWWRDPDWSYWYDARDSLRVCRRGIYETSGNGPGVVLMPGTTEHERLQRALEVAK